MSKVTDVTHRKPRWKVRMMIGVRKDAKAKWHDRWWWEWWTPEWHDGRGPYISIGLGLFAIYRGY